MYGGDVAKPGTFLDINARYFEKMRVFAFAHRTLLDARCRSSLLWKLLSPLTTASRKLGSLPAHKRVNALINHVLGFLEEPR